VPQQTIPGTHSSLESENEAFCNCQSSRLPDPRLINPHSNASRLGLGRHHRSHGGSPHQRRMRRLLAETETSTKRPPRIPAQILVDALSAVLEMNIAIEWWDDTIEGGDDDIASTSSTTTTNTTTMKTKVFHSSSSTNEPVRMISLIPFLLPSSSSNDESILTTPHYGKWDVLLSAFEHALKDTSIVSFLFSNPKHPQSQSHQSSILLWFYRLYGRTQSILQKGTRLRLWIGWPNQWDVKSLP